ncbi:uncharacterized protein (DUF58 family) [Paenibacillus mucilaginosus]|uniref:DUF58 domain-containing protein n=1 Tax=Paenibacillus mucilaginosus TaxID=61624 RepID=UPI003D224328
MRSVLLFLGWLAGAGWSAAWAFLWGGRTAWFTFYAMAFLLLYTGGLLWSARRGVRVEAGQGSGAAPVSGEEQDRTVEHGDPVHLIYSVRLPSGWAPGIWVLLEEAWVHQGTGERHLVRMASPLRRSGADLQGGLPPLRRGCYRREVQEVRLSDAFGLLQVKVGVVERTAAAADKVKTGEPGGQAAGLETGLPGEKKAARTGAMTDSRRGAVSGKNAGQPAGWAAASDDDPTGGGQIWVLPRCLSAAAWPAGSLGDGRPVQRRAWSAAEVPQLSGTRPYAPGDPLRRIHWRSSARTGDLRAKELEPPGPGRQLVLLDAAGAGGSEGAALWADPLLTAAAEAAAGLLRRSLAEGRRVRLAVSDAQGSAAEAHGSARLAGLLRLLAAVPRGGAAADSGGGSFAALVLRETRSAAGGALTLVTARADAQLPQVLRRLPKGAAGVVFVHGPGELPEHVHAWKRQLEALGCPVTLVPAGTAPVPVPAEEGGVRHAVWGT